MKEIVYSGQKNGYLQGVRYANPRLFNRPREGVNSVIIIGEWDRVADAYRINGVAVRRFASPEDFAAWHGKRPASSPEEQDHGAARKDDLSTIALPPEAQDGDMTWPEVRTLAKAITGHAPKNRASGLAVIANERQRRADAAAAGEKTAPQPGGAGAGDEAES